MNARTFRTWNEKTVLNFGSDFVFGFRTKSFHCTDSEPLFTLRYLERSLCGTFLVHYFIHVVNPSSLTRYNSIISIISLYIFLHSIPHSIKREERFREPSRVVLSIWNLSALSEKHCSGWEIENSPERNPRELKHTMQKYCESLLENWQERKLKGIHSCSVSLCWQILALGSLPESRQWTTKMIPKYRFVQIESFAFF